MIQPGTLHMKDCIAGLGTLSTMEEILYNSGWYIEWGGGRIVQ